MPRPYDFIAIVDGAKALGGLCLLGAETVGKDTGELIHCFSRPLAMRATVFDLIRAPRSHPTPAESITCPLAEIAAQVSVL